MKTLLAAALTILLPILPEPTPHHPRPEPPPITAPAPTQPYPCIVGIVFANGVPVLTLICDNNQ